jgi:hypothetical protein
MTDSPDRSPEARPLQVGVFLDDDPPAAWARRCLDAILALDSVEPCLVAESVGTAAPSESVLFRLYRGLDRRLFRSGPEALKREPLGQRLEGVSRLTLHPRPEGNHDLYSDEEVDAVRKFALDVGIWLRARRPGGRMADAATHGMWIHLLGDREPGGWWEVVQGRPVTVSGLAAAGADADGDRVLLLSHGATDRRSPGRNINAILWKTADFARRKIVELHASGSLTSLPGGTDRPIAPVVSRIHRSPGNLSTLVAAVRLGVRWAADRLRYLRTREQWQLAVRVGGDPFDPGGYRPVAPPGDRFWAAPFPFRHQGRTYLFFEECPDATRRGHIAVAEVDGSGRLETPRTVLAKDYHLSYPFLLTWNETIYMVPETSEHRTVEIYRCLSFPDDWELERVLLENVIAVDATLLEQDGRWWMFVNQAQQGASDWDELHLYYATTPLGPWTPHRSNPVRSDVRSTRPAGQIFRRDGAWIRPTQDCSVRYGYATVLNRIEHLDTERYEETEIGRLLPNDGQRAIATHTLNAAENLFVIDQKVLVPRPWRRRVAPATV